MIVSKFLSNFLVFSLFSSVIIVVPLLLCVAFVTLVERKVLASGQRRRGPNVVGSFGLLQPFADGLKLITKETVLPSASNRLLFILAPNLTLFLSFISWCVIPMQYGVVLADVNLGIIFVLAISSLGVYGIIISGWSSNSKYAFLGSLRSAAQMISYEVSMGIVAATVVLCSGSFNFMDIVESQRFVWYCIPLFPSFIIFFVSSLAETNRPPFDLPEAEAELVSGYNVEYSGVGFALFFIGEYANIILMSTLSVLLFLGGWLPLFFFEYLGIPSILPGLIWFITKWSLILICFILSRASLPRYRYDQLMRLGWKIYLPISFSWFVFIGGLLFLLE